jgi:hypothetical protein
MFDSGNYGCEVIVMCDVRLEDLLSTYSGFCVVRVDDNTEIAKFYEGDPHEDYDTAMSYAKSIASRIAKSPVIDKFWKKLGREPREVKL